MAKTKHTISIDPQLWALGKAHGANLSNLLEQMIQLKYGSTQKIFGEGLETCIACKKRIKLLESYLYVFRPPFLIDEKGKKYDVSKYYSLILWSYCGDCNHIPKNLIPLALADQRTKNIFVEMISQLKDDLTTLELVHPGYILIPRTINFIAASQNTTEDEVKSYFKRRMSERTQDTPAHPNSI